MANLLPEVPGLTARVGESGRLRTILITKENRKEARNLTGWSARVLFWYLDQAPHAVHMATIDPLNGLVKHVDKAGQFTTGERHIFMQAELVPPNWYMNGNVGQAFHVVATDIVTIYVMGAPV